MIADPSLLEEAERFSKETIATLAQNKSKSESVGIDLNRNALHPQSPRVILPEKRVQLYHHAVNTLIDTWNQWRSLARIDVGGTQLPATLCRNGTRSPRYPTQEIVCLRSDLSLCVRYRDRLHACFSFVYRTQVICTRVFGPLNRTQAVYARVNDLGTVLNPFTPV